MEREVVLRCEYCGKIWREWATQAICICPRCDRICRESEAMENHLPIQDDGIEVTQ